MYNVKLTFQPFSMQKDLLSEVPLGERVHRENDVLAAAQHYWVPSADPQEWYRIHSPDDAQIQDHGEMNSIPVQAAQYRKVHRGRFARLFKKEPEANQIEVPLTQSDKYELLERQQKARSALLVWANQAGVHLDQGKLEQLFGTASEQTELENGMRLAWGTKQPSSTEERQQIERVREMGDRLIVELSKHGQVVADLQAEGAKRICVGIKHNHGTADSFIEWENNVSLFQEFLRHQRTLVECQRTVIEICGARHVHFFIESFSHLDYEMAEDIRIILGNGFACYDRLELVLSQAENDPSSAQEYMEGLSTTIASRDTMLLKQQKALLCGSQRFVKLMLTQGQIDKSHLHGHMTIDSTETNKADLMRSAQSWMQYDDETFDRLCNEEIARQGVLQFKKEHPHLIDQILSFTASDNIALIILGANHFVSGAIQLHNAKLDQYRLENYILREPRLADMRLIVIDPLHLRLASLPTERS